MLFKRVKYKFYFSFKHWKLKSDAIKVGNNGLMSNEQMNSENEG